MLSLHVAWICDIYHLQTPSLPKSGSVRFSGKFSGRQTKPQVQVQLFGRTLRDQMSLNQVYVNSWGILVTMYHPQKGALVIRGIQIIQEREEVSKARRYLGPGYEQDENAGRGCCNVRVQV